MTDFCHSDGPLIGGSLARHQLIFEVNFNHLAH